MRLLDKEMSTVPESKLDTDSYFLDDCEFSWRVPAGKVNLMLVIHCTLRPDLMSLVHMVHGHRAVPSTLVLLRERFHWPSIIRGVREGAEIVVARES